MPVRLIGGLAVRMHIGSDTEPVFQREYKDIDLATVKGKSKQVTELMLATGYEADRQFNATERPPPAAVLRRRQPASGGRVRRLIRDVPRDPDLRADSARPTRDPLAELLLTKFQIVQLNAKDQTDILTMLYHHDVTDHDEGTINATRVAELCAADWGLWRTTKMNVERVRAAPPDCGLDAAGQALVTERLERLWQRIQDQPKSGKWKMRNRVGDKKRWYEEPEEVE